MVFEFVIGFTIALGMATTAVTIIQNSLASTKKNSKPPVNVVVVMEQSLPPDNRSELAQLESPREQPITVTLEKPVALLCSGKSKRSLTTYDRNRKSSTSSVDNILIKTA